VGVACSMGGATGDDGLRSDSTGMGLRETTEEVGSEGGGCSSILGEFIFLVGSTVGWGEFATACSDENATGGSPPLTPSLEEEDRFRSEGTNNCPLSRSIECVGGLRCVLLRGWKKMPAGWPSGLCIISPEDGDAPSLVAASEKYSTLSDMPKGDGGQCET